MFVKTSGLEKILFIHRLFAGRTEALTISLNNGSRAGTIQVLHIVEINFHNNSPFLFSFYSTGLGPASDVEIYFTYLLYKSFIISKIKSCFENIFML